MAVTTTTIAGTDSLSGSRITINDNFKTLEDALNSVLSAFDIVSGRFDNSAYGSANDILTNGMVINGTGLTNALNINFGNLNLQAGNITLPLANWITIGNDLKLNNTNVATLTGNYPTWDLRDTSLTSDTVAGIILPNLTAGGFGAIDTASIPIGTLAFTEDNAASGFPLRLWWDDGQGAGATWWAIGATTVI